jgi:hypothetical protein
VLIAESKKWKNSGRYVEKKISSEGLHVGQPLARHAGLISADFASLFGGIVLEILLTDLQAGLTIQWSKSVHRLSKAVWLWVFFFFPPPPLPGLTLKECVV